MLIAGGTDLVPNMKRRHQTPATLVSLRRVEELRKSNGSLGACLTLTEIVESARIRERYRGLWQAAAQIATPHLRNMGTLGGNLCLDTRCTYYNQNYEWRQAIDFCLKKEGETCWVATASKRCVAVSSTDSAPALIALGAKVKLVSVSGEREVALADLYRNDGIDYLSRKPDEILTEVVLPEAEGWRSTYWKLRRRGSFDFPVLGVAAAVKMKGDTVEEARIALGAVASRPFLVDKAGAYSRRQEAHRRRHRRGGRERRLARQADGQHRPRPVLAQGSRRRLRRLRAEGAARRRHARHALAHRAPGARIGPPDRATHRPQAAHARGNAPL